MIRKIIQQVAKAVALPCNELGEFKAAITAAPLRSAPD
jgi:hypothetical protein